MLNILTLAFVAVLILGVGFVAGGWIAGLASVRLSRSGMDPLARQLVASLIKPIIVIISLVVALQYVGFDLTSVTAILGAATLAIGLSLRDSLANVAAGAVLLTLRPFTAGDFVDAGTESGTVQDLTLFMTRLKTPQGVIISIPNANITKNSVRNYTRSGQRRIDIDISVASGHVGTALEMLPKVLADVQGVLAEPATGSMVVDPVPGGVRVRGMAWTKSSDFGTTKARCNVAVDEAFATLGIETVSPLRALLETPR